MAERVALGESNCFSSTASAEGLGGELEGDLRRQRKLWEKMQTKRDEKGRRC